MRWLYILLLCTVPSLLFALENVKIGVLAKRGSQKTIEIWSPTAAYLNHEIEGYHFEVVPLSFEDLAKSVAKGEVDFVLTNTTYYVELEYRYGVSRIATLKNVSSSGDVLTSFGGVIFTKQKSDIRTLSDLKGKRFGAVNISSFGGWVMAQKELHDHGIDSNDFSQFRFFNSHDAVVLAVKNGIVDAGTVRTDTIERMGQEGLVDPKVCQVLAQKHYEGFPFRVSTALYPEWPFAKLSSTSDDLANKVLIALLKMPADSEAARFSHVAGWTIPLDYSKVHTLLEELHLGPYKELGKLTLERIFEKYKAWIFTLLGLFFGVVAILLYIFNLNSRLRDKQFEIKQLNSGLEHKVFERTEELEKRIAHEKYLKDVLKTVADINELLITSFSIQTVVQNCMDTLVKQQHYRFVWIGLIEENMLEVVSQSEVNENILDQRHYRLNDHESNFAFKSVKSAIELNTTILEKMPEDYCVELDKDRYECSLHWMISLPIRSSEQDEPLGSLAVFSKRKEGFENEEIKMLENLATDVGMTIHGIKQRSMLEAMELEKINNYEETILAFVNIIEQRDSYTAGHTLRVAEYSRKIATQMQIEEQQIHKLEKAAILHDIGKVVTPDAILLKPGKLNALEYDLIKQHSNAGYRMLSKIDMYKDLAEIIRYHHVRYDGKGYPITEPHDNKHVPMLSYIMVLADAFDAMTTNRIYKRRESVEEAFNEIKANSGTQFHPEVVKAGLIALADVKAVETTQMPSTDFEQRRFAYFFLDALTDLYNESYLQIVMIAMDNDTRCLHRIELKHFYEYNHKYGWEEGNRFLQRLADELRTRYPKAMIFRYHGDNFVLIFNEHNALASETVEQFDLFKDTGLSIRMTHYDLSEGVPKL